MKSRLSLLFLPLLLASVVAVAQQAASPAPQAAPHAAASQAAVPAEEIWADLTAGNRRFITGMTEPHALVPLRQSLAKGQHPKAMVLSCSDSRVPPELLFDQSLGDLFVVRSAGNIAKGDALLEAAVQENVHQSARDVLAHSEVLRQAKEGGHLTVFEAEYQLDTGKVVRLDKVDKTAP